MAMSGGKDDGSPMMEMNTTPLIDVMLVLLIMFIITIPVATHAVNIDLPNPSAPPPLTVIKRDKNKVSITPAAVEGMGATAFSFSNSRSVWPFVTSSPTFTKMLTIVPDSEPSPNFGSFTSIKIFSARARRYSKKISSGDCG